METPNISIITVGMNHLKYIKDLYKSLFETVPPKTSIEAIYVDNCSTDGSVEYIKTHYPHVKILINKTPKGFGENNNIGALASQGKYLAIINPDVILHLSSLDHLFHYAESHTGVGIITPQLLNSDKTVQYSIRGFITLKMLFWRLLTRGDDTSQHHEVARYLCKDINFSETQAVNWSIGAAFFISRDWYAQLGGFDQDYFLYMEDEDLCLRSWKQDAPVIYYPNSKMTHNHLRASSKLGKKSIIHLKSMFTFFKKHGFKIPNYAFEYNKKYSDTNITKGN